MATPPRSTAAEVDATISRITRRHAKVDDPHREKLGTDPRDVLDYLREYDGSHLPRWVRQADVSDALTLHVWLWWEDRRRLHRTLSAGKRLGLFLTQLGAPLGIRSAQGTQDLLDRLSALLRYDRPDEQLSREARRVAVGDQARVLWVVRNWAALHQVSTRLVAAADRYGVVDREWLDELAADSRDEAFTPASVVILGLATEELRTSPGIVDLVSTHAVHRDLLAADRLRTAFSRIQ